MRNAAIVTAIYCVLFVILTTPTGHSVFGLSAETFARAHHFLAELVFWIGALVICASGTYGAYVRQDRFSLSQEHPLLNRVLSLLLLVSPFFAVLWNVRFIYILLGLLLLSHIRSKTERDMEVNFLQSRTLSNLILLPIFTLAMMLMAEHGYEVSSIFHWESTTSASESPIDQPTTTDEQEEQ